MKGDAKNKQEKKNGSISQIDIRRMLDSQRARAVFESSAPVMGFTRTDGRISLPIADTLIDALQNFGFAANQTLLQGIEILSQSVGRIGPAIGSPHIGTGFLIAPDIVATASHVVSAITGPQWNLIDQQFISFDAWPDSAVPSNAVEIDSVILHADAKSFDCAKRGAEIALLKLKTPLPNFITPRRTWQLPYGMSAVAVIGFPAPAPQKDRNLLMSGGRTVGDIIDRVFGTGQHALYGSKSVGIGIGYGDATGRANYLHHTAPTLGGCSGGPVIDLNTMSVVGVHCAGESMVVNQQQLFSFYNRPAFSSDPNYATTIHSLIA